MAFFIYENGVYFCPVLKEMSIWLCVAAALVACSNAERPSSEPIVLDGVSYHEMPVNPLPGLNIPRMCHSLFAVGDELVVIGGHTTGFIPTKTAEYLSGDKWRLVETHYAHDDGFAVMSNGLPMVGGGYEGDFESDKAGAQNCTTPPHMAFPTSPFWTASARTHRP